MNKTIEKCLNLKEEVSAFRQKASDAEREYEQTIITLSEQYANIEKNLESFLEENILLKAIYEQEIGRKNDGQYIRDIKPWILFGDLMNEQMQIINSHTDCNVAVEYSKWDNDSECGQVAIEQGTIIRASIERPSWFPPEKIGYPAVTIRLESGKEKQHDMTTMLTCYAGRYELSHTSRMTIIDKLNNPQSFPNRRMFEVERVAREALKIYEYLKGGQNN